MITLYLENGEIKIAKTKEIKTNIKDRKDFKNKHSLISYLAANQGYIHNDQQLLYKALNI